MKVFAVTLVLLTLLSSRVHSQADELTISSPKTNLVVYEPLLLNGVGQVKRFTKRTVYFVITGPTGTRTNSEFGQGTKHRLERLPDGSQRFAGFWCLWYADDYPNYLFEQPGKYRVRAYNSTNQIGSNELEIRVDPFPKAEAKLAPFFNSLTNLIVLAFGDKEGAAASPWRTILEDYPNSIYTPYIAFLMFDENRQFAAEGDTLTQLKGKFRPLQRLPVPSGWHAEVMWRATAAKGKLQRVKEGVDDALLFLKLYPNHAYAEEAMRLLEEAKEFEKEKAANKISNIEKSTASLVAASSANGR